MVYLAIYRFNLIGTTQNCLLANVIKTQNSKLFYASVLIAYSYLYNIQVQNEFYLIRHINKTFFFFLSDEVVEFSFIFF